MASRDDQPVIEVQGARMPALGFGTFELQGNQCYGMVRTALDLGYRHVDTARFYENEEDVGRALKDADVDRDAVFLTTKIWRDDLAPDAMRRSAEDALRALKVDVVDLLLVHWPNEVFPLGPTIETLGRLREEGKARFVGVSNFPSALVREARGFGVELLCDQVEYHVLLSQDPLLETLRGSDMVLTAYSPLARGRIFDEPELKAVADKHGVTVTQIALAWLLQQENVAAIPKTSSPDHARANLAALDVVLEPEDLRRIAALPKDVRTIDPPFAPDWDA